MNIQNETIRINIEIDDRDLLRLQDVISDLNNTLSDMNTSVGNVVDALSGLQPSSGIIGGTVGAIGLMAGAIGLLATDGQALQDNIVSLTKRTFPNFSREMDNAGSTLGGLITTFRRTSDSAGGFTTALMNKKGAIGLLGGAIKLLPLALLAGGIWFLIEAIRNSSDAICDVNKRLNEARQAHQDAIYDIDANTQANQRLIDRLKELQRAEELSAGARKESIILVEQLNDRIDGLNLVVNSSTGKLDENSQAVLGLISKNQDLIDTLDRIRYYQELWFNVSKGYEELEIRAQRYARAIESFEALYEDGGEYAEYYAVALSVVQGAYDRTRAEQEKFGEELEDLTDSIEDYAERWERTWRTLAVTHNLTLRELNDTQKEIVHELANRWTSYRDNAREMFDHVNQDTKLWRTVTNEAGDEVRESFMATEATHDEVMRAMIENMRSNREAVSNWSNNLDTLAEKTSHEFADHMRSMGVESASVIEAMVNGNGDLLQELAAEFELAGTQATQNIGNSLGEGRSYILPIVEDLVNGAENTMMDRIEKHFPEIGIAIPAGLMEGVREGSAEAISELQTFAEKFGLCFRTIMQINSPSGLFKGYGENIIQGLIQGLNKLQKRPINILETVVRDMQRAYNSSERDFQGIGRGIMTGLNQGLINGEPQVMATARRIADNISRTMQQALQINSPSRVMREQIGRQIPAGVAVGIEKYSDYAIDSVEDLGKELTKVNFPSMSEILSPRPSFNITGLTGGSALTTDNRVINHNNYDRLFEGANIHWHNKQDIRKTMEEIAWASQEDNMRMW